ncbi:MAG TPA: PEP-CTERM sorting domain-containing protein [Armatimonadota bacterium]|jgi:hypothetical protein
MRILHLVAISAVTTVLSVPAFAGSIFITGHDPDFHAAIGSNATGASNLLTTGVNYAKNGSALPLLYLHDESTPVLAGHVNSTLGLNAAGITYVEKNAAQFTTENLANYSAILVPSSFGGNLTQAELDAVNARSADLINYINAGGGLVALAETPNDASLATTNLFGFLPFLVISNPVDQSEVGNTVTPFGASLGLTNTDINGNASHCVFTATGGMDVVDNDAAGRILSLAYRGQIGTKGVVPEPGTLAFLLAGGLPLLALKRRVRG